MDIQIIEHIKKSYSWQKSLTLVIGRFQNGKQEKAVQMYR